MNRSNGLYSRAAVGGGFQGDQLLLLSAVYCQRLRQIDCSFAQNVRDTTVAALAEASLKLESLQLNGAQNLTDEAVRVLAHHHGPTLRHLEFYGCFNLTDSSLGTLAHRLPSVAPLVSGHLPKTERSCSGRVFFSAAPPGGA